MRIGRDAVRRVLVRRLPDCERDLRSAGPRGAPAAVRTAMGFSVIGAWIFSAVAIGELVTAQVTVSYRPTYIPAGDEFGRPESPRRYDRSADVSTELV